MINVRYLKKRIEDIFNIYLLHSKCSVYITERRSCDTRTMVKSTEGFWECVRVYACQSLYSLCIFKLYLIKYDIDCDYTYPIDLRSNKIPFVAKSIGKV